MIRVGGFVLCLVVFAHASDVWVENTPIKTPLKKIPIKRETLKPHALLDERLSRVVPGAFRGSLAEKEATAALTVALEAVSPTADLTETDDTLKLKFTVTNPTEKDIKMCARDTPIEGASGKILSNLFVVQNPAGMVMQYRGVDVKRTEQPSSAEMIVVKAGQSVSDTIVLDDYSFAGDGLYYIRVKQPMDEHILYTDVMSTQVTVTLKGTKEHQARFVAKQKEKETSSETILAQTDVGTISANGCTASELATITGWHQDALHKIDAAIACTESSCQSQVDTWFGAQTTQSQFSAQVTTQFQTMKNVQANTIYRCESGNSDMSRVCGGSTFAYVYPTDSAQNVYMCDFTFNYPDYSEKVQTVIHELSHFNHIGNTNDNAYGESTCINLAQSNFQAAIQTADNVGYFGKYANKCYRNAPSGYIPKNSPLVGCVDQYSNCQALAADGCSTAEQGYCCSSCSGGAAANDCSGVSDGGSSGGPSPPPPTPAPAPPTPTTATDTAGNCAELVNNYGCDACCISGSSGGTVASVCAGTCASSSTPAPTPAPAQTRRRRYTAPAPPPTPAPAPPSSSCTDQNSACTSWAASYDCNAQYNINGATTFLKDYCPESCGNCGGSSSGGSSSSGNDSCTYANDGVCDEPTFCDTGTDATDCA